MPSTIEYVLLLGAVSAGIISSYTDIKHRRIKNIYTFPLLAIGILGNLFLVFTVNASLINFIIVFLSSFALSVMFWYMKIWTAGDAKLLWGMASSLPATFYSHLDPIRVAYMFILLPLTPIFLISLFQMFRRINRKNFLLIARKILSIKYLIPSLANFIWIFGMISVFYALANTQSNIILSLVLSVVSIRLLYRRLERNSFFNILFKAPFFIYFFYLVYLNPLQTITNFLMLFFLISILRRFLYESSLQAFTQEVSISDLKEGMIIGERVFYSNKIGFYKSGIDGASKKNSRTVIDYLPDGLTKNDINKLQNLKKKGKLNFNTIGVQETMYFAPFILAGYVIIISMLFFGFFI